MEVPTAITVLLCPSQYSSSVSLRPPPPLFSVPFLRPHSLSSRLHSLPSRLSPSSRPLSAFYPLKYPLIKLHRHHFYVVIPRVEQSRMLIVCSGKLVPFSGGNNMRFGDISSRGGVHSPSIGNKQEAATTLGLLAYVLYKKCIFTYWGE